jgi:hypothetical protein
MMQQSPLFSSQVLDMAAGELLEIAPPGKGSSLPLISVTTYFHNGSAIISHNSFFLCPLPLLVSQEQLDCANKATKAAVLNLESRGVHYY